MEISRRGFLQFLGMAAAAVAAEQVLPDLARVYSFPSAVKVYQPHDLTALHCVALQLEKVRYKLPLLYEREDALFKLFDKREYAT